MKRRRDQRERVAALEKKKHEELKTKESATEYIDGLLPSVFDSLDKSGDNFVTNKATN